jgi:hypothetical protein
MWFLPLIEKFLILTDSVVRDFNLVHDTTPIQNSATFHHPNQINKPEAGLFTQGLFKKVKGCARGGEVDLPSTLLTAESLLADYCR